MPKSSCKFIRQTWNFDVSKYNFNFGRLGSLFSPKAKQVMTSFDLAAIVQELNENIIGSRLDNIYQVSPLTLLLAFYPRQSLIVEAGRRIHLTQYEMEKPKFPSLFCTILRRLLNGGVVHEVQMDGFERVVTLEITSKGVPYKLVCEIFGKGNIILVDNRGIILHALSYRKMRDRNVVRGEYFKPPPQRGYNLFKITRQEFDHLQEQQGNVVQALSKILAVGGLYAEELLLRADINKKKAASSLITEEVDRVYDVVQNVVSDLTRKMPIIVLDDKGLWYDVLPFSLKTYLAFKMEKYPTYNKAADEYFTRLSLESGSSASEEMDQSIEEQKRILDQQKKHLKSLGNDADKNRHIGDIIYLCLSDFQNLFQQIAEERSKGMRWNETILRLKEEDETAAKLIESVDPAKGTLTTRVADLCFELNPRKSVFENASFFYEEAKKLEAKTEGLRRAIAETENKIESLRTQLQIKNKEEELVSPIRVKEKTWFEKFHWARSSENFLIIGGRDSSTNELLIKRYMNTDDLVFHADISGAPFVVLKTEGKTPMEQTVFEAAQLAASYSRGWKEGYSSLDVYWVRPKQISKQAPSGEFLAKGMFMVLGQKNYIRNIPLCISIGVVEKGEDLSVIGGPTSAIRGQARYLVEIIPGRQSSGVIAKTIRNSLASSATKELRKKIIKLKIEEFQMFIPAGKSEIAIR